MKFKFGFWWFYVGFETSCPKTMNENSQISTLQSLLWSVFGWKVDVWKIVEKNQTKINLFKKKNARVQITNFELKSNCF